MPRSESIAQVSFDGTAIGLVLSVRVGRAAGPKPLGSDASRFATSVQVGMPVATVEVRTRDAATAESLAVGRCGLLECVTGVTQAGQSRRRVSMARAVLHAVETVYEQSAAATAVLRFMAESVDGEVDPFAAAEVEP